MVNMNSKEFAKLIGVSQSTVSRALNNSDLVPEDKKQYILKKAEEYGFVLNSQARSLRSRRTETIGILFPKHFVSMTHNLMLAHVYDALRKELNNQNYDIMVINYSPEKEDYSSFESFIKKRKVDGFFILRMELSDNEIQVIEKFNVPCVFVLNAGSKVRGDFNYFFSDSRYGGYLAGQFFGQFKKYEKYFISVTDESKDSERRVIGYKEGLLEHGYQLQEANILQCQISIDSAYDLTMQNIEKFKEKKSAIFTYNDIVALGVLNACRDANVKIPEQVQIIGMDDILFASTNKPSLSTLHVPVEEMVSQSCELLINLINNENVFQQEWLKPTLKLRESTLEI